MQGNNYPHALQPELIGDDVFLPAEMVLCYIYHANFIFPSLIHVMNLSASASPRLRHLFCWCLFILSWTGIPAHAQNKYKIDSLEKALNRSATDSSRIALLNSFSQEIVDLDPEKAIDAAQKARAMALKRHDKAAEAEALRNAGYGYYNQASYKIALSYFLDALHLQEGLRNKKGILSCCTAIGNLYLELRQFGEAQNYFQRTRGLADEMNLKRGKASSCIGLGNVFSGMHDYKQALTYYTDALKMFKELNEPASVATAYNNIAAVYDKQKNFAKALVYINKASSIYEESGNTFGLTLALNNTAYFYNAMGNYDKAIEFYKRGLEKAKAMGANDRILESCKGLSLAYQKLGRYKEALKLSEFCLGLGDTVYNKESYRQMAEMQARFDKAKNEQQIALMTRDKKLRDVEFGRRSLIIWALTGGISLVLLLALVAVWGYMQKKKGNDQLADKNKKIETAYNIIEEQHNDIKDSIRYAQRIQEAILPARLFQECFGKNGFVLFKPKDIVSGDFFWVEKSGPESLLAAVDCTGHGVPGAFMSIVGYNLLKQAVKEKDRTVPAEILNEINLGLTETLRQTEDSTSVKDGMDIALIALCDMPDKKTKLQFAGANNPVWIFRKKEPVSLSSGPSWELEEIKGDKFPIGIFLGQEMHKFSNHERILEPGDTVYVFSDGYADQFGGPRGKKFKYKTLKELLLSVQHQTMEEQKILLEQTIEGWRGNLEQVDDILILGLRMGQASV